MIEIPILDMAGKKVGVEQLDPEALGGRVRHDLLKQAVVTYRANKRLGTVQTLTRAMVHGASRKLYRQKGTGRARAGNLRTPVRRGGGHAFAKINRDFTQTLPRQMRRLARNSAILAKAKSGSAVIVQGLTFDAPKTSRFAGMLKALGADRGALVAVSEKSENVWKSARNIQGSKLRMIWDLNAYEVLKYRKLVLTPEAFKSLVSDPMTVGNPAAKA